jgi:hypothetical protein
VHIPLAILDPAIMVTRAASQAQSEDQDIIWVAVPHEGSTDEDDEEQHEI